MAEAVQGRAAFQVLVLPYRQTEGGLLYALFRRLDGAYWQGVAGGSEAGETPLQAARREAAEEAGLGGDFEFIELDVQATIPVVSVTGEFTWGPEVLVIPEHAFGVRADCIAVGAVQRAHRVQLVLPQQGNVGGALGFQPDSVVGT
ncbi:NUDIX domain-containing protein [Streptomyces sp. NPDC001492]